MTEFYDWIMVVFKEDGDGSRTFHKAEVNVVNHVLKIVEDGMRYNYPMWMVKSWHGSA